MDKCLQDTKTIIWIIVRLNCDIQHLAEYFLNRLLSEDEFDEAVHAIIISKG